MTANILAKLFEHNKWANLQMIQACSALTDEQLDAPPKSASYGSIRSTLLHLVTGERGYLALLTLPIEARPRDPLPFAELRNAASLSGEGLLALARDESGEPRQTLRTRDGYLVESWVVMLQAINHATEHREQLSNMLTSLGGTSPDLDGWTFGEVTKALTPAPT